MNKYMRIKYFAFTLVTFCLTSCFHANLFEAMRISKNFIKEYTGLDTLIRIDGYYYMEDSTSVISPFIFSNDNTFQISPGRYNHKNHAYIQKGLQEDIGTRWMCKGNYNLLGDTIKTKWVIPYALGGYYIYSGRYLIVNDTTIRRIWRSFESPVEKSETETNDIYHFYEYKFDKQF